ncbi:hypothetical protein F3Y22_tig00014086pilonHSYRG00003 [Hibiscus syriacus]|uniref:Uncharacterized protein n=1 Tax=Hibiscus syriacus TaxID=106335 RepID=A0A6A3C3X8_HIBSY|nr:hypothetical protein F3Y22_tig00014086pilonHSYRG00003 [Hibiscus syriacus]
MPQKLSWVSSQAPRYSLRLAPIHNGYKVKLAARAFYDDVTTKGDNQPKTGRGDNRGIAVVVLDALTRYSVVKLKC